MSLDLSPEIENIVRKRAAAQGVSVNDLLARAFAPETIQTPPPKEPMEHVRSLLVQWQAQDNTPTLPLIPTRPGETPIQTLFRKWEEEDANLTEQEQAQDEKFWEEFQQSINADRAKKGMRTLF